MIERSEWIEIPASRYVYRVVHRIMEGNCQYDHGPRMVEVPHLMMDKYPVTNAMYQRFMDESGYVPEDGHHFLVHWADGRCPAGQEDLPVVWVCRRDAEAYAAWNHARLPYDFEWQYAACGPEKLKYPWGDAFDAAKCNADGPGLTPVDAHPDGESPFGAADMCGNAYEWVADEIYDGMHRFTFLRGGCWFRCKDFWHTDGGPRPNDHHLKFQLLNDGHNRCGTVGFRCVREVL